MILHSRLRSAPICSTFMNLNSGKNQVEIKTNLLERSSQLPPLWPAGDRNIRENYTKTGYHQIKNLFRYAAPD